MTARGSAPDRPWECQAVGRVGRVADREAQVEILQQFAVTIHLAPWSRVPVWRVEWGRGTGPRAEVRGPRRRTRPCNLPDFAYIRRPAPSPGSRGGATAA